MADQQQEFVYVRLGGGESSDSPPGYVSKEAFENIWKGKGFVVVDDEEGALASSPETQAEMAAAEPTSTSRKKG